MEEKVETEVSEKWRKTTNLFHHIGCGGCAVLHPKTNAVWGCKKCGLTTCSPSLLFKPGEEKKE